MWSGKTRTTLLNTRSGRSTGTLTRMKILALAPTHPRSRTHRSTILQAGGLTSPSKTTSQDPAPTKTSHRRTKQINSPLHKTTNPLSYQSNKRPDQMLTKHAVTKMKRAPGACVLGTVWRLIMTFRDQMHTIQQSIPAPTRAGCRCADAVAGCGLAFDHWLRAAAIQAFAFHYK